jgi:acyl carrier protein
MKDAQEKITRILSKAAMIDPSKILLESKLDELGIDSLDRIECVLSIEEDFKVELREADLWKLRTVQDVVNSVQQALAANA